MKTASLQAWDANGRQGEPFDAPARDCEAPRSGQTVSGYGRALPAPYVVQLGGRWRRVYVAQIGNAGTAYIGRPGAWSHVVESVD